MSAENGMRVLSPSGDGAPPPAPSQFVIATPGNPQPEMLRSLIPLVKPPGTVYVEGTKMEPGRAKLNMAEARNALVRDFLEAHERWPDQVSEPLQWLFMVDGDAVLHPLTLLRLQSWAKPVVGALCVARYAPYAPVVYRGVAKEEGPLMRSYYIQYDEVTEWCKRHPEIVQAGGPALLDPAPEDSLHPEDWTGTHCFLVHRKVYERVGDPWFEMAPRIRFGSGSDRIFFDKVRGCGVDVYVDFSVVAGHAARVVLGLADFLAWQSISYRDPAEAGCPSIRAAEKGGPTEEVLEGGEHGGAVFCGDDAPQTEGGVSVPLKERGTTRAGGDHGEAIFCGDNREIGESESGVDVEPTSEGVRAARTLAGADPGILAAAAGRLAGGAGS